jgi:hypothetical protein
MPRRCAAAADMSMCLSSRRSRKTSGREAHLSGRVAQTLQERSGDLFARPPVIERIDVPACKLP